MLRSERLHNLFYLHKLEFRPTDDQIPCLHMALMCLLRYLRYESAFFVHIYLFRPIYISSVNSYTFIRRRYCVFIVVRYAGPFVLDPPCAPWLYRISTTIINLQPPTFKRERSFIQNIEFATRKLAKLSPSYTALIAPLMIRYFHILRISRLSFHRFFRPHNEIA